MVFVEKNHNKFLIFSVLVAVLSIGIVSSFVAYADDEVRTMVCSAGQVMVGIMGFDDDDGISIVCRADSLASSGLIPLHFEHKGILAVPSDSSISNLTQFAVWKIVKDPTVEENSVIGSLEGMTAHAKITEGTGDLFLGFFISPDGENWSSQKIVSTDNTSLKPVLAREAVDPIERDTRYLAFGAFTTNDATIGEIKDISGTVLLTLPVGYAIQQVLPETLPPVGDDHCANEYYDDDDDDDDDCDEDDDDDDDDDD